jgi:Kef-type K+ transport system membrane component KefB/predicted amino acid-binding ACT domain protein
VDPGPLLLRLALALVAARAAAELAERFRQPVVLAEIAAGIVLGPSLIGAVHRDEIFSTLGELGAILLLFEVGMHMDLADLRRVGAASMRVACIGVVVPMAAGYGVMLLMGLDSTQALFLGAAITATSVGITARVFADLRVLATSEARTVLGAAVADDVLGLLILTVVLRVSAGGGVDVASIAGIVGTAIGFLVVGTIVSSFLAPPAVDAVAERARGDGTLLVLALALALALAGVAAAARLAPIVGAFVAGVAVARSPWRDEMQKRLAPVGHLLIPVFFLSMGVDTDVRAFGNPRTLAIAGVLGVVAVAGKIVAGLGVRRGAGDRSLIGIGMIPRGEVGLIFASLGLSGRILSGRQHAALLLVILATTVITPPWLRVRTRAIRRRERPEATPEPAGGWLVLTPNVVELALGAEPPDTLAPRLGLEAALACATRRPGERLTAWLSSAPPEQVTWDDGLRAGLWAMLLAGSARSWRLLDATGQLAGLLPEVAVALRRRTTDPFDLDPDGALRFTALDELTGMIREGRNAAVEVWSQLDNGHLAALAALSRSVFVGSGWSAAARRMAARLGLPDEHADDVAFLVEERRLLPSAANRFDLGAEDAVLELAAHLGTRWRSDALYVLAAAESRGDPAARDAIEELHGLVDEALSHPELTGAEAEGIVEARRAAALEALKPSLPEPVARHLLEAAPRRYLLAHPPETISRHIRMIETRPVRGEVRLEAEPGSEPGDWVVHVAVLDRPGVLAAITGGLADEGVSIEEAWVSTWRNGIAIDSFVVRAPDTTEWERVRESVARALTAHRPEPLVPVEAEIVIDNHSSPWHTVIELQAADRAGLLHRVVTAFAQVGIDIHTARVSTREGIAYDQFSVTGRNGGKLTGAEERSALAALAGRSLRRWWTIPRRGGKVRPDPDPDPDPGRSEGDGERPDASRTPIVERDARRA